MWIRDLCGCHVYITTRQKRFPQPTTGEIFPQHSFPALNCKHSCWIVVYTRVHTSYTYQQKFNPVIHPYLQLHHNSIVMLNRASKMFRHPYSTTHLATQHATLIINTLTSSLTAITAKSIITARHVNKFKRTSTEISQSTSHWTTELYGQCLQRPSAVVACSGPSNDWLINFHHCVCGWTGRVKWWLWSGWRGGFVEADVWKIYLYVEFGMTYVVVSILVPCVYCLFLVLSFDPMLSNPEWRIR